MSDLRETVAQSRKMLERWFLYSDRQRKEQFEAMLEHLAPDDATEGEDECTCPEHGRWLAAEDILRMVRELDVAMNGDDASPQAKLCDIQRQLLERIAASPSVSPVGPKEEK